MNATPQKAILIGVGGGVAAYKTVAAVSALRKAGLDVRVAMTESARAFVGPLTFAAVSGHPVLEQIMPQPGHQTLEDIYPHLYPATGADVFLLAPATANQMANIAMGKGDDIVCCSALSLPPGCRKIFAPAMNVEMWNNPAVQRNVRQLEADGWLRLGPDAGHLACGMQGAGRMVEPDRLVAAVQSALVESKTWADKKVLILSGPTREHLDPIRYLGNPSSGKMGKQLAEAALQRGAHVQFVSGPVHESQLPVHGNCQVHRITSAEEMLKTAEGLIQYTDFIFYVAAVADYRPAVRSSEKLPKQEGSFTLELVNTPDIAATLCAHKKPGQTAIGFALQTHDGAAYATEKLERKNLDGIILNYPDSLNSENGRFTMISRNAPAQDWGSVSKSECARRIMDTAETLHHPEKI